MYFGSGWDGVIFPYSSPNDAVLWIATQTAFLIYPCFSYCWSVSAWCWAFNSWLFFFFFFFPLKEYSVLYGVVLSNKSWGKEGERVGIFVVMGFLFPSNHDVCWRHAFQEVARHLPADGKQWMSCFICFSCIHSFASPINLSLSWPTSFDTCFSDSLPHPTVGEWARD